MSSGHYHRVPNRLTPGAGPALTHFLTTGSSPALMNRWERSNFDYDVPFTTGHNIAGTVRYADRDFVRALYDPTYARRLVGEPIDTGLSPDDTLECLLRHEAVEKVILDSDCPIDEYNPGLDGLVPGAHDYATFAEHLLVRQKGSTPHKYERGLEKIMHYCLHKPLKTVPPDLACAPLLDDPDPHILPVLNALMCLGIQDAFRLSKASVEYGSLGGKDCCSTCNHWLAERGQELSRCELVEGLVRHDRNCTRFHVRVENPERRSRARQSFPLRIPMRFSCGTFVVPVRVSETITLDFIVDSGASHVSVPADVVAILIRAKQLEQKDFTGHLTYILADGTASPSDTFLIRSLSVGNRLIQNVEASVAPARADPLLGQSFLKRFRSWSIDNRTHELVLEPN
jgi:gag-polyprotein putative aspartyl protease